MTVLLALAFFLSGIGGLVYETIWARYLGLFLGHRAYAQTLVLVIFLGGTALGALGASGITRRVRRPLLAYVVAEGAIGALALVFHPLYVGATGLAYDHLFASLAGRPALILLAQWFLAAILILPQSVLLGTTFPLMSAAILRRRPDASGHVLALLYAVNSLGGALGVLLAGFWLVGTVGLPGTIIAGGVASLVATVLAAVAWWREPKWTPDTIAEPSQPVGESGGAANERRTMVLLVGVAFGTALTSLVYEIAWSRMLSLVLGSASHSFELMLSAFVLGLGIGALWLRTRVDDYADPMRTLGVVQWAMGGLALVSLPLYVSSFHWTAALLTALTPTPQGYALFTLFRYGLCLAIMLPATFCAGMTLPLLTHVLLRITKREAVVGVAYAANTFGAIVGVILAAIVFMPLVGVRGLVLGSALLDMTLGVVLLTVRRAGHPSAATLAWAVAAGSLVVVFGTAWQTRFDPALVTSGVYRTRKVTPAGGQKIVFYRDGRTATVSAAYTPPGRTTISTNGKVDASLDDAWYHKLAVSAPRRVLGDDAGTQTLMPLIGLAYVPQARTAAVIGHGSGMSSHFLLGSPTIESVTTVEIEPEMILGSSVFYPVNRRVFDDARSHFVIADARSFFSASTAQYDVVLSEPSNPWVSGVSSLFTQEYYARVARRLAPDGVLVQWVQMYETNDALLLGILAAVHRTFRSYALYYTGAVDLVIVAGNETTLREPDWSVVRLPGIAADLADFAPFTLQSLEALRFADRATFAPLLDRDVAPNSDFHPTLDRDAEEQRFLANTATGFATLASERFDPFSALTGERHPIGREPATPFPEIARAREAALAARLHLRGDTAQRASRDEQEQAALLRQSMFETFLAAGKAPDDWQLWVRNLVLVERNLHGLAAGADDERFYNRVRQYLQRTRAPAGAIASVTFLQSLATWDFAAASTAADQLMPSLALGVSWVPTTTLREGAVTAKLLTGDVSGARQAFEMLTPAKERTALRTRLLEAHLAALESR